MSDLIDRQAAIDVLDVLCQEHRYKIPGKMETYSQYNEAWQDALDRAEGAIFNLPSAQPEIIYCKDCKHRNTDECPMYYEEWIEYDEGDGFIERDFISHDRTVSDGFCFKGERREDE